jgi:hypothetical protein
MQRPASLWCNTQGHEAADFRLHGLRPAAATNTLRGVVSRIVTTVLGEALQRRNRKANCPHEGRPRDPRRSRSDKIQ